MIERFSRPASASPATATTCRVRTSPPTTSDTASARTARALLWWFIRLPPVFECTCLAATLRRRGLYEVQGVYTAPCHMQPGRGLFLRPTTPGRHLTYVSFTLQLLRLWWRHHCTPW